MAVNRPSAFARADCANLGSRERCLGILPESLAPGDGPVRAVRQARCRLALTPPERCPYFERVVLPLADWPSPKGQPKLQAWRLAAREEYRATFGGREPRKCRKCGGVAAARAQYCEKCRGLRRRQNWRNEKKRQRRVGCPTKPACKPA